LFENKEKNQEIEEAPLHHAKGLLLILNDIKNP